MSFDTINHDCIRKTGPDDLQNPFQLLDFIILSGEGI